MEITIENATKFNLGNKEGKKEENRLIESVAGIWEKLPMNVQYLF